VRTCNLLSVVLVFLTIPLTAQGPAWPPPPGHLTMPMWPNEVPGASGSTAGAPAEVDTTRQKTI
jgi:hypothetical protein